MDTEKETILKKYFNSIEDKGTYVACMLIGQSRIWMYDNKLINLFSSEKLETLVANQIYK